MLGDFLSYSRVRENTHKNQRKIFGMNHRKKFDKSCYVHIERYLIKEI